MSKAHKNVFKAFRSGAFTAMIPASIKHNGIRITTNKQIGKLKLDIANNKLTK